MRTWLIIAALAGLSVLIGAGIVIWQIRLLDTVEPGADPSAPRGKKPPASSPVLINPLAPRPKVVVDQEDYDFGSMDSSVTLSHAFRFTNQGDADLTLEKGETSCKCTIAALAGNRIAPGQSVEVKLEWTAKGRGGDFHQNAIILTNDPARPRVILNVAGKVVQSLEAVPSDVVFSRVGTGESKTAEVLLYAFRSEQLQVVRHSFTQPSTAKYFAVTFAPLPAGELKVPGAKSGCSMSITLKPGLPLGAIRQKIRLETNLKGTEPLEVPIQGTVAGDLSVIGKDWNADTGVLTLGTVRSREGAKRTLKILVRGAYRKQVRFRIVEKMPKWLNATLGPMTEINNATVVQVPLLIEIRPGAPSVSHLNKEQGGLGRIVLETGHPEVGQLPVYVSFAVED
ncbi:MAG: DUF1573 domain-containing protein [Pirellulales bacterium]